MSSDSKNEVGTDLIGLGRIGVQLIQTGEKFLEKLLGPYLEARGELLAEKVQQRRRNLMTISGMAAEIAGSTPIHEVPGRILFPLLEAAANEESAEMQRRWAALLANAATHPAMMPPSFPRILADLSPVDAQLLDYLHHNSDHGQPSRRNTLSSLLERFGTDYLKLSVPLANLEQHGLIAQLGYPDKDPHEFENTDVVITPFGDAFVRACGPPLRILDAPGPNEPLRAVLVERPKE